jgi:hypothetical protein
MREQFQQFQLLKTHQDDADEAIVESGLGSSRPSGRIAARAVFVVCLRTNPASVMPQGVVGHPRNPGNWDGGWGAPRAAPSRVSLSVQVRRQPEGAASLGPSGPSDNAAPAGRGKRISHGSAQARTSSCSSSSQAGGPWPAHSGPSSRQPWHGRCWASSWRLGGSSVGCGVSSLLIVPS